MTILKSMLITNLCPVRLLGVIVSLLVSSLVDSGLKSWLGWGKYYEIGICSFSSRPL